MIPRRRAAAGGAAPDPLLVDLAAAAHGGTIVRASDQYFGAPDRLLAAEPPTDEPERLTGRGRWLDGWVTRRRRGGTWAP